MDGDFCLLQNCASSSVTSRPTLECRPNWLETLKHKYTVILTTIVLFFGIALSTFLGFGTGLNVFVSFVCGILLVHCLFGRKFQSLLSNIQRTRAEASAFCQPAWNGECSACTRSDHLRTMVSSDQLIELMLIPAVVDAALEEFLHETLEKYIYFWHQDITQDGSFLCEFKESIRCLVAVLVKRMQKVDLPGLIMRKLLRSGLSHLDCYLQAGRGKGGSDKAFTEDAVFDYYGSNLHVAVYNRNAELRYLHCLCERLLPYLLPPRYLRCRTFSYLIRELFGSSILLYAMDSIADPDVINNLLITLFDKTPMTHYPPVTEEPVKILEHFVSSSHMQSCTKLGHEISFPATQQTYLYPFMTFLKNEGCVGILQFYLAVEDFKDKLLNPDLKDKDIFCLHQEVKKLYEVYMAPHGVDRLNFSKQIVEEFKKAALNKSVLAKAGFTWGRFSLKESSHPGDSLTNLVYRDSKQSKVPERGLFEGPYKTVVRLRTTPHLYEAHEYVYNLLERSVPLFCRSEEYYEHICGSAMRRKPLKVSDKSSRKRSSSSTAAKIGSKINRIRGVLMPVSAIPRKSVKVMDSLHAKQCQHCLAWIDGRIEEELAPDLADAGFEADEMKMDLDSAYGDLDDLSVRDLNAWRVSIPRVDSHKDESGKQYFAYVIDVQRIDVMNKENPDQFHWVVERRYHEFYVLESKLTEFHGEFVDIHLPVKKSFGARGIEYLELRRAAFEEFLQRLLQKPAFRGSELLFTFLTSTGDFTKGLLPDINLGRMIKNVPMKLVKERGQHLECFLQNFVNSAETAKAKQLKMEYKDTYSYPQSIVTRRLQKSIYADNAGKRSNQLSSTPPRSKSVLPVRNFCGYVIYIYVVFPVETLKRTDEDRRLRSREALVKTKAFLPRLLVSVIGQERHDDGFEKLFELVQHPRLNKQLLYTLLDTIVYELFPELGGGTERANNGAGDQAKSCNGILDIGREAVQ